MMKSLVLLFLAALAATHAHDDVMSVHGSGTTNPSKCFWLLMQQITERAKWPIRLSYRAVGSGTGQAEFIGTTVNETDFVPSNDFGSGDIPLSTEDYDSLQGEGIGVAHFPFVLGAISVFHSVPNVPKDVPGQGLNLTGCLLAKIFRRSIVFWDDQEILDQNPMLESYLPSANFPINVAHRVHGSSSTASVTQYLHKKCDTEWPVDLVGKNITWPADTEGCEGSAGMTTCILQTPGTIGYIDSGHGHEEGLNEIELQNFNKKYLTSKDAAENGGIAAAATAVPTSVFEDFGQVSLLDQPGDFTWPIVAMSYVYVRKDLSHIHSPEEQTLLKAFLRTLYEPSYIDQCVDLFRFSKVPDSVRQQALDGIEQLELTSDTVEEWILESSPLENVGQGDFVISEKRRTFAEYERTNLATDAGALGNHVGTLRERLESLQQKVIDLEELVEQQQAIAAQAQQQNGVNDELAADQLLDEIEQFTEEDEQRVTTALVLASLSIVFSAITMMVMIGRIVGNKRAGDASSDANGVPKGVAT